MRAIVELSRGIPKTEVHCHLEGTMRPSTLEELGRRHGIDLGVSAADDLYSFTDLTTFFRLFRAAQSVLQTHEDWARLAYESVLDAARANVIYREAFISPAYFLGGGQNISDIVAGLAEGLEAGQQETGVCTMLIGGIDRAFGPDAGLELVEGLVELRRRNAKGSERLIGIGMDGIELGTRPSDYSPAFALARKAGFHRTSHQGAEGPPSNITDALDILGCERIDHGLSILDDRALADRARKDRIPLNVCPSSNLSVGRYPSLHHHPFHKMRKAGLLATLNSDDPAFTRVDLADEYGTIADTFSMTWDEVLEMTFDGVEATWLTDAERREVTRKIKSYSDSVTATHTPNNLR